MDHHHRWKRCNRFSGSHVISYRLQLRLISNSKSDYPTVLLTCNYAVCRVRQLENRILMMIIFVSPLSLSLYHPVRSSRNRKIFFFLKTVANSRESPRKRVTWFHRWYSASEIFVLSRVQLWEYRSSKLTAFYRARGCNVNPRKRALRKYKLNGHAVLQTFLKMRFHAIQRWKIIRYVRDCYYLYTKLIFVNFQFARYPRPDSSFRNISTKLNFIANCAIIYRDVCRKLSERSWEEAIGRAYCPRAYVQVNAATKKLVIRA